MSVPKSKRTESSIQFLQTASEINRMTRKLAMALPKRYTFFGGTELTHLAAECHHHMKAANSIFPVNAHELQLRRDHLTEGNNALQALLDELDIVYQEYPDMRKRVENIVGLAVAEAKLISGVKDADKRRFKNLIQV